MRRQIDRFFLSDQSRIAHRVNLINNLSDHVALELVRDPILLTHPMSFLASKTTKQGVYKSWGY
jgi:hypothetical protein